MTVQSREEGKEEEKDSTWLGGRICGDVYKTSP
jgi:hypothetical protein